MQTITNMMSSTSHMDVLFYSLSTEEGIILLICLNVRFWLFLPNIASTSNTGAMRAYLYISLYVEG